MLPEMNMVVDKKYPFDHLLTGIYFSCDDFMPAASQGRNDTAFALNEG
jgi:hypothetical protein